MDTGIQQADMRVFIAGATGVMGCRVVPTLVKRGYKVTAIARSRYAWEKLLRTGARPVEVDLFDAAAVRKVVAGQDVVINLATSIPANPRMFFPGAWRMNDRIRSHASTNLVKAALAGGVSRYIQESFAPIYPDRGDQWIDESTPVHPVKYNRSVLDAEAAASRFTHQGRTGVVLRFAYLYGPDSSVTRDMIRYARRGWAAMFGPPEGFYTSLSHDDAATAVVAALNVPAGIYNIAEDEPLRRQEYVDSLASALGVPTPKLPPRGMERLMGSMGEMLVRSQRISNRKFKAASTWVLKYPSMYEGWRAVLAALEQGSKTTVMESAH